ncbi:MAG: 30S ribosomal protein S7 [Candidatus Pacebacteria bacterium CG_4_10_14_0_8_um_filter_43_12]|uniref:Small ribosomal subunit protein uS7 n=1 Tax=Candidatus Roizmanbacteria bacterium CG_4_10_14_0_2_um_filter_39_13 TaxID=1974825 RepID=A0A2M7TYZ9_9BACT|nr:MAG: 30S ribosomal protein S7 [Candidatus Pacebacteria bacterium CG10_big_fil_rev_8_21_14_0_10_44_11]PIY79026.1 MAG: 30S ribosomal protein S7 [Candidatus Pacebacteria bacterium CG_4_10_14_0_8_um_filter_43_12]PIZ63036.1 MAG: 30S ribosomal protein S7 [Candidatus Roizmanbacteria bacterium CG_4_10_14_0_2_um_filter_39_13]
MRAKRAPIRMTEPDTLYGSARIAKLINYVTKDGKRTVAMKQVYSALDLAAQETKKKPLEVFEAVIDSVTPQMEVRSRRVGGAAYQVPMPVRPRRGFALALRWLVQEARKRSSKQYHSFAEKLMAEMLDSLQNQGGAIQRKMTSHRMADANKAFAHFRW